MSNQFDSVEKALQESLSDNNTKKLFLKILERFDSIDRNFKEVREDIARLGRKIKDLEEDRRTDLSIARATRRMKFFEKMPQELQGNAFTEDIKDYY